MALGAPVSCGTTTSASSSSNTVVHTLTASIAIGDLILVDVTNDGGANLPSGVVDSKGHTYSALDAGQRDADDYSRRTFAAVCTSAMTTADTVTATIVGGGGTWDRIIAVTKVTPDTGKTWVIASLVDKTAAATGTSTSPDSGLTATTTDADELIWGVMVAGGAPSSSGGGPLTAATNSNTKLHNVNGGAFIDLATVYRLPNATGTYRASGTWQASDLWACTVFALKQTTAGGGDQSTSPTGIASAEAFGSPTLAPGNVNVGPTGIASGETFGAPTIAAGPVSFSVVGIASAEAFGTPSVTGSQFVNPTGIPSAEAFGTPTLVPGNLNLGVTGIPSVEAFGTPVVAHNNQVIVLSGIPSQEVFGVPTIIGGESDEVDLYERRTRGYGV